MHIALESAAEPTARAKQVAGMFDLPAAAGSRLEWDAEPPPGERGWNVGLITGPSGCGKSTVARRLFAPGPGCLWSDRLGGWPAAASVLDGFPAESPVRDAVAWLSAVGFSSPPAWLRPYRELSTGQRFRADLARLLASLKPEQVGAFDEFTSVVDRTVARVGSAALAKAVRRRGLKFVAVTCHEDVIDWLQPDWVFRPEAARLPRTPSAEPAFAWRSVRRRPGVALDVQRCTPAAWGRFAAHHYLSHSLNRSAVCFLASHGGEPVGFSAWLNHFSKRGGRREHRTVILPDWQGVGVGMRLSSLIASAWRGVGERAVSTTTHPAFVAARRRSPDWRMTRPPSLGGPSGRHAGLRLTAGFEYVGPAMPAADARRLLGR